MLAYWRNECKSILETVKHRANVSYYLGDDCHFEIREKGLLVIFTCQVSFVKKISFIFISLNDLLLILYELLLEHHCSESRAVEATPRLYMRRNGKSAKRLCNFTLPFASRIELGSSHLNELSDWALNRFIQGSSKLVYIVIKMNWPSLKK